VNDTLKFKFETVFYVFLHIGYEATQEEGVQEVDPRHRLETARETVIAEGRATVIEKVVAGSTPAGPSFVLASEQHTKASQVLLLFPSSHQQQYDNCVTTVSQQCHNSVTTV
jgi:hypothetical protein